MTQDKGMGRRTFLKAMGLGAAGAGLIMAVPGCAGGKTSTGITYADTVPWTHAYDVICVGFGAAGASAAITAADEGASVLILEKAPVGHEGGNTRYSGQNFGVIDADEADLFKEYYRNIRGQYSTPSDELIDAWIDEMVNNEEWVKGLVDELEYRRASKLEEPNKAPEGLTDVYRMIMGSCNWKVDGVSYGRGLWNILYYNVKKRADKINVWFNAPALELIQDPMSKAIIGVRCEKDSREYYVRANNGVIMTCGGYENSPRHLEDFACLTQVHPTGTLYNTGDGVDMVAKVGGRIWHQCNTLNGYSVLGIDTQGRACFKNVFGGTKKKGAYIRVGRLGQRICDETYGSKHGRKELQDETFKPETYDVMWNVFDETMRTSGIASGGGIMVSKGLEAEIEAGLVLKADTLEELAKLMSEASNVDIVGNPVDIPGENLAETVKLYNEYCEAGWDQQWNRDPETLVPFDNGPYYAWRAVRSIINSQGGAERNGKAEILDNDGRAIPHLYGAGEFGFIASMCYNGGHNTGDCAAMGRIAGRNAAAAKDPLPEIVFETVEAPENPGMEDFGDDPYMSWTNSGNDYYGSHCGLSMMTAKVTMDGDKIAAIEFVDMRETGGVGSVAVEKLTAQIIETQQISCDTVTGATYTSKGVMGAVANALRNDFPELVEQYDADFRADLEASLKKKDAGRE